MVSTEDKRELRGRSRQIRTAFVSSSRSVLIIHCRQFEWCVSSRVVQISGQIKSLEWDTHYALTKVILSDKQHSSMEFPGFVRSSGVNHRSSNPTLGAFGSTPCVDSRHIQQIVRVNSVTLQTWQLGISQLDRQWRVSQFRCSW